MDKLDFSLIFFVILQKVSKNHIIAVIIMKLKLLHVFVDMSSNIYNSIFIYFSQDLESMI